MREIDEKIKTDKIDEAVENLVFFRGTKDEIEQELNKIKTKKESVTLEPFEDPLSENDLGFNVNLGQVRDASLDYIIYMLPTNKKDTFLITEVLAIWREM